MLFILPYTSEKRENSSCIGDDIDKELLVVIIPQNWSVQLVIWNEVTTLNECRVRSSTHSTRYKKYLFHYPTILHSQVTSTTPLAFLLFDSIPSKERTKSMAFTVSLTTHIHGTTQCKNLPPLSSHLCKSSFFHFGCF